MAQCIETYLDHTAAANSNLGQTNITLRSMLSCNTNLKEYQWYSFRLLQGCPRKSYHWCFYHKRFGDNANNCKLPCNHPAAPKIATVTTCRAKRAQAQLLYVKDDFSGWRFLVDSGAFVSVFPASGPDTCSHRPSALVEAVNGSKIRTYGHKQITLSINGRKYAWQFLVADVTQPLLGGDFLCSNTLMVDVKGQRLVDPTTYTSSSTAEESLTPVATELHYQFLLTILRS